MRTLTIQSIPFREETRHWRCERLNGGHFDRRSGDDGHSRGRFGDV
jgi:hypothetical protein